MKTQMRFVNLIFYVIILHVLGIFIIDMVLEIFGGIAAIISYFGFFVTMIIIGSIVVADIENDKSL
jgi:hypothetical protein